ncbi:MAG TPA: GNAT family N-acetyltransferase [Novosphingobium sp.]|nr:GNAT family N-acetyltransferase [Novosphingobium sp.]
MGAEFVIERRGEARRRPTPARAVVAGDSVLVVGSWRRWADGGTIARWDALARGVAEPNPFLESWYLLPALRRFDPAGQVEIVRFERGGELIGLMPVERAWRYGRWPVPHLRGWLHPNCFTGAPLVARGAERAFWAAFLAWADANAGPALFAHVSHLPLDGALAEALFAEAGRDGRRAALVHREERALLKSSLSPADYLDQAVRAKKRKELRRQHARLAEQGKLKLERTAGERSLATWIDHFLALEASGWKGRGGSALASDPATAGLFRDALTGAAERGRLERISLTLDGRPIAMLANFIVPPGACSYKTAFDERYARFSPGVLLQLENLALLDRPEVEWCDSCAAPDHPMIDGLWSGRRAIGRVSIAIGGAVRRGVFERAVDLELARHPVAG